MYMGGRDPVKFADKLTQLAKSEDSQFLALAARVEQVCAGWCLGSGGRKGGDG